ncbi:MAG: 30S ribosomal protein S20 [Clostridia bacterium]|nr:30S ribosomal protein S20 [Clostridia bacterium]
MPNIKSAKKRVLVSKAKHERNIAEKSALKTSVKKARKAIAENADNKEEVVKQTFKDLDSGASRGIIHKNAAARKKSRMAKAMNAQAK